MSNAKNPKEMMLTYTGTITMKPEGAFLVDLFSAFNESSIDYCVLRNYDGLPYDLRGSDLDILLTINFLERAIHIIGAMARKHNGFAVWREWNDCLHVVLSSGICDNGEKWGVHIDLFTALRWKGLDYYQSDRVLSRAFLKNRVRVASDMDSSLISFLKEILHCSRTRKDYAPSAAVAYRKSPFSIKKELELIFGRQVETLVMLLETQNLGLIKKSARKLRQGLLANRAIRYSRNTFRNKIYRHFVHFYRLWRKPGLLVAVTGLDGAGKSTLIAFVRNDIKRLLKIKAEYRHHRPGLLPPLAIFAGRRVEQAALLANPHSKPPSRAMGSIIRLAYYTIDYFVGYWVCIYPALIKFPTIFFFDRYFYDYYIDPVRYRIRTPWWMVKLFSFFIPEPDVTIMIKPKPEEFHKRKPELPLEELRQQSKRMNILAKKLKNIVWIDTSGNIEDARQAMMRAILKRLEGHPNWK